MKTITLVAQKRPEYLAQVIASLRANDTRGWCLVAIVDAHDSAENFECVKQVMDIEFMPKVVLTPANTLGVNYANKRVYDNALKFGSELNVAVEDDTPLALDCLAMVNWWDNAGRGERGILSCFSNNREPNDADLIEPAPFCPWVWAAARPAMEALLAGWMSDENGWDWSCMATCKEKKILVEAPQLSRSRNIGKESGAHYTPELFDAHFTGHVASDGSSRNYRFS